MKYPIGIQDFASIRQDGYVYVDKTDLIYRLVSQGKTYFLSRPRRFGKSLLLSTLKHYFLGHKELFGGLAIEEMEQNWFEYPVFHLTFGGQNFNNAHELTSVLNGFVAAGEQMYGTRANNDTLGSRFAGMLKAAHEKTGRRVVVLIDEYDKPLLDVMGLNLYMTDNDGNRWTIEEYNRNVLKNFYSVFKEADPDLQFVLLTGVTKFSQVSVFSGFNQPADLSLDPHYEALCGITAEELSHYFNEPIQAMADKYHVEELTVREMLKKQYDGYHFSDNLTDIYNPFSLLNAFASTRIDDYWFRTGTPSYLVRLLEYARENLNELTGKYYDPSEFIDYKADTEKPLPMIYQSGYLTIKAYNFEQNTFLLDFPNNEVKKGLVTLIANRYLQTETDTGHWARKSTDALKKGDIHLFMSLLTAFLADIPYSMRRKQNNREQERDFHYTFYLLMRMISIYTIYTEKQQSKGRVDCIIETPDYIYLFEFKLDGKAEEALQQIERQGYALPYSADRRKLFKIGVDFSSTSGTVDQWKYVEE